jgi:protein phosphatase
MFAIAAWLLRPWGMMLLWPAISLGVVALAYVSLGPGIFRKADGGLDIATRFVLGPYLAGAWLTFPSYRRRASAWTTVTNNLIVGRRVSEREAKQLIGEGVTAVLDLTAECAAPRSFKRLAYTNVPVLDLTVPTMRQFRAGVAFIRAHVKGGRRVYVHCALGYSRSASIVAAYLLAEGLANTAADAVAIVRAARPQILVGEAAVKAIEALAKSEGRELESAASDHVGAPALSSTWS